jgi:hypothetical protein
MVGCLKSEAFGKKVWKAYSRTEPLNSCVTNQCHLRHINSSLFLKQPLQNHLTTLLSILPTYVSAHMLELARYVKDINISASLVKGAFL